MRKIPTFILALFIGLTNVYLRGEGLYGQNFSLYFSNQTFGQPLDRYAQSDLALSKGMFLVAARNLLDPNFSQTVVLLIDYSENGAVGLVINRPSLVDLDEVFPDLKGERIRKSAVFIGGPVAVDELFFIILSEKQPEESFHVFDEVYISSNLDLLEKIAREKDGKEKFRVYAGYAGWAPDQLEMEVSLGGWYVMHADVESIFSKEPRDVWSELIYKSSAQWTLFIDMHISSSLQ
jgi:putative transcriptional regulator